MIRAGLVALCAWVCALVCVQPAWAGAPRTLDEELVPRGAWQLRISRATDTLDSAIDRLNVERPLLNWLVPSASLRGTLTGSVERDVERTDFSLTYGLGDRWNLLLEVPYVRIDQRSTVAGSSGSSESQEQAARLASREVSGLGRLRVGSLHRTVFSDRHGLVWTYGLDVPLADPVSPWEGRGTLQLDSPVMRLFGGLHYTFYPLGTANRLDARLEAGTPRPETLTIANGTSAEVDDGQNLELQVGWQQEFGGVTAGFGFGALRQGRSSIGGAGQSDARVDLSAELHLGYGNLSALEQGPLTFPYRVLFSLEQTLQGYNVPLRNELRLSLQTYF